jgi:allantoate deiminase
MLSFTGKAGHAGATPMNLRRDALAGAAEWITFVENLAKSTTGLVATVGRLKVEPGAVNVIAGAARASLDARHREDAARQQAAEEVLTAAKQIADRRGLQVEWEKRMDQPAVSMDAGMLKMLEGAVKASGFPVHRMASGAGHDAMVLAEKAPAAMLFLRSPGGISHHPEETVLVEDVAAALTVGLHFLEELETTHG